MSTLLTALLPVFAIVLIGWLARRLDLVAEGFWQPAESMTFYLFFPALLVISAATARIDGSEIVPLLVAICGAILLVAVATLPLRRLLGLDGPAFTSLLQGAIRPNVYVGIAGAQALFGQEGLALLSVAIAVGIPLVNAISVIALLRWGAASGSRFGAAAILLPLLRNPLIVACLIGIGLNLTGIGAPPLLRPLLTILGSAALPVGLLAVGAGLELRAIGGAGMSVAVASVLKILLLPAATLLLCTALGVGGQARGAAMLFASLPVSASAYVMARQMGGDAPLLAGIITLTTILAAVSMPLVLALSG